MNTDEDENSTVSDTKSVTKVIEHANISPEKQSVPTMNTITKEV